VYDYEWQLSVIRASPSQSTHLKRRVGLGIGLGDWPWLLTRICNEGEKHCCSLEMKILWLARTLPEIHFWFHLAGISTRAAVDTHTFFPIPLVGDGAGDTGIKSIRFGDDDADFSKSLSLCGGGCTRKIELLHLCRLYSIIWWLEEYYTTNWLCSSENIGCSMLLVTPPTRWWAFTGPGQVGR
jgi:hypothetical protein